MSMDHSMPDTDYIFLHLVCSSNVMQLLILRTIMKPAYLIAALFLIVTWNAQVFRYMQQPVQTKGSALIGGAIPTAPVVSTHFQNLTGIVT